MQTSSAASSPFKNAMIFVAKKGPGKPDINAMLQLAYISRVKLEILCIHSRGSQNYLANLDQSSDSDI